jgi:O-antigen ligase
MVFNFLVVVLLASRTQVFILLLLGTAFVLYQSFIRKQLLKGVFFLLLVYGMGLAFVLLNPVTRERFIDSNRPGAHFSDNKYGEGGLSLRLYKWKYTLETIAEHPFLGTGTGDSQDKLQETYKKHDFKIGYDLRFNAHNQFLQTMLELGVFGFISLCICLLVPAVLAYRKKEWIYLAFLTVFSISCLTESMMEVNKGITFYAFFNSLFAFHFLNKQEE